jgi:hypothetical protein
MTIIILKGVLWVMEINKDNIDKMVEYINIELRKNSKVSVNKLCDRIGVKQSTFKTWVHRAGYRFDFENRNYNKDDNNSDKNMTTVINSKPIEKVEQSQEDDKSNTLVINDEVIKNNIINLAKNHDKIISMLQKYDKEYDKEYDGMVIELPVETIENFRTSIRVNNVVWEQFSQFTEEHKEFTKRDLLSMALKEYMNKYK